ncbi:hypothetical protein NO932_06805 [Pelagibacterium sp. 26DY04]|uniref:hypothetical protein n=1 Tax=Pelagibacterium sp. 26DY04 TaxID=2967130 RepID=UPI002815AA9B|nr:hypothetical protein [Pelagibacterium sp. 26DY04]WMT88315.1 hypothetical protein NO932_06805 [Pelagibacterium sp. 26DY04]
MVFVKYLEGKTFADKLAQVGIFAVTRAALIGALGVAAVVIGTAFIGFQKAAWIVLGAIYVAIGLLYTFRRAGSLKISLGPGLGGLSGSRGSVALGLLFGLNIPACAAPLIFVLLGMAAAGGVSGATISAGFVSLGLFGLALSLPIVAAVLIPSARRALDWLSALSRRLPLWTGLLLVVLGLWSIGFGLFAEIKA